MAGDQKTTEPGPEFESYLEWIDKVDPRTPEALSPPSQSLPYLPFKPVSPTKKDLSYLNRVFSDYDGYESLAWVRDYHSLDGRFIFGGRVGDGKKLDAHLDTFCAENNASKGVLLPCLATAVESSDTDIPRALRKRGVEELKPSDLLKAARVVRDFLANGIVSYYDPFTQEVELRTMNRLRESWGEDGLDAFFRQMVEVERVVDEEEARANEGLRRSQERLEATSPSRTLVKGALSAKPNIAFASMRGVGFHLSAWAKTIRLFERWGVHITMGHASVTTTEMYLDDLQNERNDMKNMSHCRRTSSKKAKG